jgi:hypothetical protein
MAMSSAVVTGVNSTLIEDLRASHGDGTVSWKMEKCLENAWKMGKCPEI